MVLDELKWSLLYIVNNMIDAYWVQDSFVTNGLRMLSFLTDDWWLCFFVSKIKLPVRNIH